LRIPAAAPSEATAVVAHYLLKRFQGLEPRGFRGGVKVHEFRNAATHRRDHGHLAFLEGGCHDVVTGPDFVGPLGDDGAEQRRVAFGPRRPRTRSGCVAVGGRPPRLSLIPGNKEIFARCLKPLDNTLVPRENVLGTEVLAEGVSSPNRIRA